MNHLRIATGAIALTAAMCTLGIADAAEVKILSSGALKLALTQLLPGFQTSSRNAVRIEYDIAGSIADRVRKGEAADVAIVTKSQLEGLERQGKIVQGTGVDIAGIAIGVAVRKGAPKPDISTVEALKQALLSARSIGYLDPATGSASGVYTARMLEQLGIAHLLHAKIKLISSQGDHPENAFQAVASGEIELHIGQITEIVLAPGVELAGPLPGELQSITMLTAGVTTASKAQEAARALIGFLSNSSTVAVLKADGFQPASKN
jgi:molybdate transport system substrate-binding protein